MCRSSSLRLPLVLALVGCRQPSEATAVGPQAAADAEVGGRLEARTAGEATLDGARAADPAAATVSAPSATPVVSQVLAWRPVAGGVDYGTLRLPPTPAGGDGLLHVVRVSPGAARLRLFAISGAGGEAKTARAWCDAERQLAVINAGMFEADARTHSGYLRIGAHVNNDARPKSYKAALLFDPRRPGLPPFQLVDVNPAVPDLRWESYDSVSQNLRLIRGEGRGAWKENGRRWSEAAVAQDRQGRLLLLFTRTPFSMAELNLRLLHSPLDIVRAMHVEGGPEASLSVRGDGISLDLAGSFATGFTDNDDNAGQWPLPNVLGVGPAGG
ncbi:MAG: phosphodiester glycosidase family protein [Deltaproteobacteria bacterium]|nr:phosphodiester glycosidase family protein [Deltaproteobacteria bacterium]